MMGRRKIIDPGRPRRIRSNFTNGLRELPVRVRLA
jgi:hypothetical protein